MGPITGRCGCGALTATCTGDPVRISVCHCHDCQLRSGSAFSAQIRFASEDVTIAGESRSWSRVGDSGGKGTFHFCPTCGSTLFYEIDAMPGVIAVAIGAFAGTELPPPCFSVWENRKLPWLEIVGDGIEHD